MTTTTRISVAEYLALPEDGPPWLEYIDGAVTEKPVPDASHSLIEGRFAGNFGSYAESHGGRAGAEGRSRFHESPDPPYMLPDLSFFRRGMRYREGRMLLPPTLAVEIRSPGQTIESQRERCRFYLTHGAEEAWLVIPETRTIEVFDGERDGTAYTSGTVPSSSLAGFVVEVEALFEGLGSEYA